MKTGCGTLFVTINTDEGGNVVELFAHHGKAGICSAAQCEAIGRLSSMSLRAGVDPEEVAHQLRGITCHEVAGMGPNKVLSCADGIAKAILHAIGKDEKQPAQATPVHMGACPKCGAGTIREANCVVCKSCGWDKCS
jgi:ribonucleoside-diphosphate reductase alpha chain